MIEGAEFDFDGFVNGIRENKPSNIVLLLDYLVQEYIRQIISLLMERGVKPGEKYIFDKRIADKIGLNKVFSGMTYLCSEKPFDDMDYSPLVIDGKYYGIWLTLEAHDFLNREEPCVLLNSNTISYAESIYNNLIKDK